MIPSQVNRLIQESVLKDVYRGFKSGASMMFRQDPEALSILHQVNRASTKTGLAKAKELIWAMREPLTGTLSPSKAQLRAATAGMIASNPVVTAPISLYGTKKIYDSITN